MFFFQNEINADSAALRRQAALRSAAAGINGNGAIVELHDYPALQNTNLTAAAAAGVATSLIERDGGWAYSRG